MGFYYISLFSIVPLGVAYGLLGLVFWAIERATRGDQSRKAILGVVGVVFLLFPISEELWIAWNFGQACKDAGTFINKKVEVDGFYDSTMRSAYENTRPGGYRFVEQPTDDRKAVERVERADEASRAKALKWYAEQNPGKELPKDKSVIYPEDERQRIVVFPNGETWRVTKLDRPTARYHYRTVASHKPVAHQLKQFEDAVIDTQTGETIARRVDYARGSNWFFIGLDRPTIFCKANRGRPLLIYREVLQPVAQ